MFITAVIRINNGGGTLFSYGTLMGNTSSSTNRGSGKVIDLNVRVGSIVNDGGKMADDRDAAINPNAPVFANNSRKYSLDV
jgi:hypothetical protein